MGDFSKYGWKIQTPKEYKGTTGPGSIGPDILYRLDNGEGHYFRMLDDDGETMCSGYLIGNKDGQEGFAPLDDFGAPHGGCTSIEYKEGRRWVPL